jgi:hypothetical protein
MNATVTIPNKYRNNSATYIFEINMDSQLYKGDYITMEFNGNWTFFENECILIEGANSDRLSHPAFFATYQRPTTSKLTLRNFSSISKGSQLSYYVRLKTPLNAGEYDLTISAFKLNGGLVEQYSRIVSINITTGYIR